MLSFSSSLMLNLRKRICYTKACRKRSGNCWAVNRSQRRLKRLRSSRKNPKRHKQSLQQLSLQHALQARLALPTEERSQRLAVR